MGFKSPFSLVSRAIDRFAGLCDLPSIRRKHVIAAQVQATLGIIPIISVTSAAITLALIYLSTNHPNFGMLLAIAIISLPVHFVALQSWWQNRKDKTCRGRAGSKAVRGSAMRATLAALYFGGLTLVLVPSMEADVVLAVTVALTSAYLITAFSLAAMAQSVFVFVGVTGIFSAVAFSKATHLIDPLMNVVITGSYLLLIPAMALLYSRDFVSRVASDLHNRDSAEVISYLLDEFESTADEWFWEIDAAGKLERMSLAFRDETGLADTNLDSIDFVDLIAGFAGNDVEAIDHIEECISAQEPFSDIEFRAVIAGQERWLAISGKPTYLSKRSFTGYLGTVKDVTRQKHTESRIVEMAHRDALTGLLNRTSFTELLNQSVRDLEREGKPFTLLFLDLDKFKLVNDTFGHPVGDELLKEVTARIKGVLRDNDPFARLGGDEFAIILQDNRDAVYAAKLASRLINAVLAPYEIEGETMWIGVSVGIAIAPQHGTQPDQILRNADLALYRAKEEGRGVFRYFEVQMDFEQREKRMLEQEMHQALENDEFHLCYQPLISTKTGRISTMEALIRWSHPIRDEVYPSEFIAIAEQSTLVVDIGKWTLLKACTDALDWPDDVSVAVNIAATHFIRGDIVSDVREVIEETGISAARLEIEITESLLIKESDDVLIKLRALKSLGCSVVMDDFGTGYSSLSYIMKFPFDKLKIDRSFVSDMDKGRNAKAILHAISSLGHNTGIRITAEGVETARQCEYLLGIHCDQLQGYFFSRPIPREEVGVYMLKNFLEALSDRTREAEPVGDLPRIAS